MGSKDRRQVSTERELADALSSHIPEIEMQLDTPVGKLVVRIKQLGPLAWAALLGVLGLGVTTVVVFAPAAPVAGITAGGSLIATLGGTAAAFSAIRLVREAKSATVIRKIRDDYVVAQHGGVVRLTRR